MPTVTLLTPADHGRDLSLEEFEASVGAEGYRYELIDGKLRVAPLPEQPHDSIEAWINQELILYAMRRSEVINYVTTKARVFVPGHRRATCPEPDVAAYADYPYRLPRRQRRWQNLSPVVVVEVVSEEDPEKDLERNVELYLQVPTIREYWIVDQRADPDAPTMIVYRRRGASWPRPIEVPAGGRYESRSLPGFVLDLAAPEARWLG
jgi:Uma2 family endonuclease